LFDGQVKDTNWLGSPNDLLAGQVIWGTGSGTGQGRMNFHSATFVVTNSIVASYDARTHANPAVAPSPVTQGWTETIGAGTSVGGDPLQVHDV
jgi:hypothetical protein